MTKDCSNRQIANDEKQKNDDEKKNEQTKYDDLEIEMSKTFDEYDMPR